MRFRKLKIAAAVIVLVVIILPLVVQALTPPPPIATNPPAAQDTPTPTPPDASAGPIDVTTPDPTPSQTPEPTTGRKPDCYTFLVVGLDEAASNTDTMMVGMLDARAHKLNIISIPRDTLVDVAWGTKKINSVYHSPKGIKVGDQTLTGIDALKYAVEQIVGFPVDSTLSWICKPFRNWWTPSAASILMCR